MFFRKKTVYPENPRIIIDVQPDRFRVFFELPDFNSMTVEDATNHLDRLTTAMYTFAISEPRALSALQGAFAHTCHQKGFLKHAEYVLSRLNVALKHNKGEYDNNSNEPLVLPSRALGALSPTGEEDE